MRAYAARRVLATVPLTQVIGQRIQPTFSLMLVLMDIRARGLGECHLEHAPGATPGA